MIEEGDSGEDNKLYDKVFKRKILTVGITIGIFLLVFFITEKPHFEVHITLPIFRSLYLFWCFIWTYPFVFLSGFFFLYGCSEKSEMCLGISIVCIALHYIFHFIKIGWKPFIDLLKSVIMHTSKGWQELMKEVYSLSFYEQTVIILLIIIIFLLLGRRCNE